MSDAALLAALYLEAVLPALPHLAAHDAALAAALAGPDLAVSLLAPAGLRTRLALTGGVASVTHLVRPADLRLWFPSAAHVVRAFDGQGRPALAVPVGGFLKLLRARRLLAAGARLETLLNTRAAPHLALHAWGNLLVGLAAGASWLRRHPDGPAQHRRLGGGWATFNCPAFPAPLWFDAATLTWGVGPPPGPVRVAVSFADLATVLAELDQRLDAPAALGLGELRIEGYLPLAEQLGIVMLHAGKLLKPQPVPSARGAK
jgi:hypothetical protein